jgi:ribosome biogenesis GTPase A
MHTGVIPASFSDQVAAQRLAMCNDIGQAAYVESAIAAALVARCIGLQPASAQKVRAQLVDAAY